MDNDDDFDSTIAVAVDVAVDAVAYYESLLVPGDIASNVENDGVPTNPLTRQHHFDCQQQRQQQKGYRWVAREKMSLQLSCCWIMIWVGGGGMVLLTWFDYCILLAGHHQNHKLQSHYYDDDIDIDIDDDSQCLRCCCCYCSCCCDLDRLLLPFVAAENRDHIPIHSKRLPFLYKNASSLPSLRFAFFSSRWWIAAMLYIASAVFITPPWSWSWCRVVKFEFGRSDVGSLFF